MVERRRLRWPLLVFAVAMAVPGVAWAVAISTNSYILAADQVQREDVYVAASAATVDGTIEGDLVVVTSRLTIRGRVTGDVLVLTQGPVVVPGVIEGSLRGVARAVHVSGEVGDDVAVAALQTTLDGNAGRDLLAWSWSVDVDGRVGRNLLGRASDVTIDGSIGGTVDMVVRQMELAPGAEVGGNVTYRTGGIYVDGDATVGGRLNAVPGRAGFFVQIVITIIRLLSVLATVAGGIVLLWLAPRSTAAATAAVTRAPWWSLAIGLGAIVAGAALFVLLAATLVGIPLALMVLLVAVLAWFFGALPAAAAVGRLALRDRGGAYGGYVAGILALHLVLFLVPMVGLPLYLLATAWGAGAWLIGAWRSRASAPPGEATLSRRG